MADLADTYEDEYTQLSQSLSRKIAGIPNSSGEAKKRVIAQCSKELDEAAELLTRFENEVKNAPPARKNKLGARMRFLRNDITKLRTDLRKNETALADDGMARGGLFDGDERDLELTNQNQSVDQRSRLLNGQERLQASSARLQNTRRVALESEEIGQTILTDLHGQRETIGRAQEHLRNTDQSLGRAGRTTRAMQRRVMTNKMIMALIIVILIGAMGTILYFKWIKKDDSEDDKAASSST